ncbi:hypothetical protein DFP72DRAFT_905091 [Ephemerocybe angulata]|uniref:Uncharacterized protein n=1 Tax=Ephemerocybe angulata TaxID=980116 RepID=A0A8H6M2L5_9AGAR|nr:hypothetical protein DFP72DRAFT_905091 [Tulosesus angulatus]
MGILSDFFSRFKPSRPPKRKTPHDGFDSDRNDSGGYPPQDRKIHVLNGASTSHLDEQNERNEERTRPDPAPRPSHPARQKIELKDADDLPDGGDARPRPQRPLPSKLPRRSSNFSTTSLILPSADHDADRSTTLNLPSKLPRRSLNFSTTSLALPPADHDADRSTIFKLRNALASSERRLATLTSQTESLQTQLSTRTFDLEHWISEASRQATKAEMLEKKLLEMNVLLEARTVELGAAQAFVTTADSVSVADVTRLVEQLNDDAFQVAADLANVVLDAKAIAPPDRLGAKEMMEVAQKAVVERWGAGTANRLRETVQDEDTVLFEALVQNAVVVFCSMIVRTLCLTSGQAEKHMRAVWDGIRKSTDLAVSKNWLALTAKHSTPKSLGVSEISADLKTLMIASSTLSASSATLDEKLSAIAAKALKVREMVNTGVLSAQVELMLPPRRAAYDAERMEDAYEEPIPVRRGEGEPSKKGRKKGEVVCATALGVSCLTLKNAAAKARPELVLKPKVLLYSTLEGDA